MPPAYPGMPLHSPPVTALSALGVLALVLVAALALVLVGSFNGLVRLRTRVDAAWAQIDVQLQRRHDLIPNLVEAVKGYAAHERGVLEEVTAARSTAVGAQGVDARGQAEQQVSGALRSLLAVAEAYPDLEADRSFLAWARYVRDNGCPGTPPSTSDLSAAQSASSGATKAKQRFVALWNPLASRYGLPNRAELDL